VRHGPASPDRLPSNSALTRTTLPWNPAGGAHVAVRDADVRDVDDVWTAGDRFGPAVGDDLSSCSAKRRSRPPSRIVTENGSIAVSVTPDTISCPGATSFAPLGRRKSAYPCCDGVAMTPSNRASPGSVAGAASGCAAGAAPPKRSAAMIVATGSRGGRVAMCTGAGPRMRQPQNATTSANAQPATNVASGARTLIADRAAIRGRYN